MTLPENKLLFYGSFIYTGFFTCILNDSTCFSFFSSFPNVILNNKRAKISNQRKIRQNYELYKKRVRKC